MNPFLPTIARLGEVEVIVSGPNGADVRLGGQHLAVYSLRSPPFLPGLSAEERIFVGRAVASICNSVGLYGATPFAALSAFEMMTCWERGTCLESAVQKSYELDRCARSLRRAGAPLGGHGGEA